MKKLLAITALAEAGYRHFDIDYDHAGFVLDAALSGVAVGVRVQL